MSMFSEHIQRVLPDIVKLRRELHASPELSFKEYSTSRRIRALLDGLPNIRVLPPYIETDVVAVLNPDRPGPCIALRADIDALPIVEENDVPYKSQVRGAMHACGHDGHTSVLMGAAMVLSAVADKLPGKVKFIFQPAEEDGGGGGVLCERGVLETPKVDAAIALHAWPTDVAGSIVVNQGPVTAANNEINITVRGRGGHGAYPHKCIDPVLIAAYIITHLQTIISRTVPPLDCGVVTIGQLTGGSASNIIPPECYMKGTVRYYRPETGELIRRRVHEIAEHVARAHGAEADVKIKTGYPPLFNDQRLFELIRDTGREVLGPDNVVIGQDASMGAEDFGFYAEKVPGAMFRLGVRPKEMETYPGLHHPRFNFNDDALPAGIGMFCELTRRFLASA